MRRGAKRCGRLTALVDLAHESVARTRTGADARVSAIEPEPAHHPESLSSGTLGLVHAAREVRRSGRSPDRFRSLSGALVLVGEQERCVESLMGDWRASNDKIASQAQERPTRDRRSSLDLPGTATARS